MTAGQAVHASSVVHRVIAAALDTGYHDQGRGHPVLLLHGSGPGVSAWSNWRLAIPFIAERFRVIAPDLAGFGSTAVPSSYDLDTWVEHALAVLDELGIKRTHVVGNSFGGALALALATRNPKRVDRLVLMGSVGVSFPITEGLEAAWGYTPSLDSMRALIGFFAHDRNLITEELVEMRYRSSLVSQESFASMFPAPRQRWIEAMATPEKAIKALTNETLIIHGRDDRVIPLSNSLRLLEMIDRSQLHVFGNCGHWVQIEHAEHFNPLVRDFLS